MFTIQVNNMKVFKYIIVAVVGLIVVMFFFRPTSVKMPVQGATSNDYNHQSFWCPWGDHHHHGVDIFAKVGTPIHPARAGVVVAVTHGLGRGGNTVSIMDCSGTIYYYAHMDSVATHIGALVGEKSLIGTVGKTGNAANTPAHLHFSMLSIWPKNHEPSDYDTKHFGDDAFKCLFHNPINMFK